MKKFNEALDEIRRDETREMRAAGDEPVLRKARWCLLKRPENLTDRQTTSLREILKHNLKAVRAWLSREDFQRFWEYSAPAWAGKFLDEWTDRTMRTRLQPLLTRTTKVDSKPFPWIPDSSEAAKTRRFSGFLTDLEVRPTFCRTRH